MGKKSGRGKSPLSKNALNDLLQAADAAVLRQVVEHVTAMRPDVRRECLHILQKHVLVTSEMKADAACRDNEALRDLAKRLEALGTDWPLDNARRIYRQLGDREKYLALRSRRMEYGLDYHDLATFHWEHGERGKALAVAREGMKKAKGRMDELRAFPADRAKESGDRQGYLELQFAQATEPLTLASYKAFRKVCKGDEWPAYEPKVLVAVERARPEERLKIHMHRAEYDRAIGILSTMRYPDTRYGGEDPLRIAAQLEERHPDQVLAFSMRGLGSLDQSMQRETYAQKARVAQKTISPRLPQYVSARRLRRFADSTQAESRKSFCHLPEDGGEPGGLPCGESLSPEVPTRDPRA